MKVINLFENFGQKDLDLAKALYMADIKHPTVVMNYSGFLPPEVESPFDHRAKTLGAEGDGNS